MGENQRSGVGGEICRRCCDHAKKGTIVVGDAQERGSADKKDLSLERRRLRERSATSLPPPPASSSSSFRELSGDELITTCWRIGKEVETELETVGQELMEELDSLDREFVGSLSEWEKTADELAKAEQVHASRCREREKIQSALAELRKNGLNSVLRRNFPTPAYLVLIVVLAVTDLAILRLFSRLLRVNSASVGLLATGIVLCILVIGHYCGNAVGIWRQRRRVAALLADEESGGFFSMAGRNVVGLRRLPSGAPAALFLGGGTLFLLGVLPDVQISFLPTDPRLPIDPKAGLFLQLLPIGGAFVGAFFHANELVDDLEFRLRLVRRARKRLRRAGKAESKSKERYRTASLQRRNRINARFDHARSQIRDGERRMMEYLEKNDTILRRQVIENLPEIKTPEWMERLRQDAARSVVSVTETTDVGSAGLREEDAEMEHILGVRLPRS